jgi:hypothetical protein
MDDVGLFYVYLTSIWCMLWPFGIFNIIWYIFSRFGMLYQEISGNPGSGYHPLPRRDLIARPIAQISLLSSGDDTTRSLHLHTMCALEHTRL